MFNNINFKANMIGYNIETNINNNIISCRIKSKNAKIKFGTQTKNSTISLNANIFSVCYCNTDLIVIGHMEEIPSFPRFVIRVEVDGKKQDVHGFLHFYTYKSYYFQSLEPIITYGKPKSTIVFKGETQQNFVDSSAMIFDYLYADNNEIYNEYLDVFDITIFLIKRV